MWLPVTPLCKPFVCKPFAHLHLHVGAQLLHLAAHGTHPPTQPFLSFLHLHVGAQLLHLAAHSTHPAIPFFSAPARRCTVVTSGCTQHPPTHPPSHSFLFCTCTSVHSCYIWLHTAPTHPAIPFFSAPARRCTVVTSGCTRHPPTQPFLSFSSAQPHPSNYLDPHLDQGW